MTSNSDKNMQDRHGEEGDVQIQHSANMACGLTCHAAYGSMGSLTLQTLIYCSEGGRKQRACCRWTRGIFCLTGCVLPM